MKRGKLQILVIIASLIITLNVSAQNAGNTEFKQSGNLWGYVFGDYYWKAHSDSAGRGGKNVQYSPLNTSFTNPAGINGAAGSSGANAFQIRRAYLGYDYNLTEKISAHIVLANEQNLDASLNNTTYLKYMYMKWEDIFAKVNLIIGQMPTPAYSLRPFGTASLWGYRSVERTLLDMHNIDNSTDLGAAVQGNIWQGKVTNDSLKPDLIGYEFMVGNGNAAKPETDIFKRFRSTIYASFLKQKLTFGIYADYFRTSLDPVKMYSATYKVYADYKTRIFKIGAEAFMQEDQNSDEYIIVNGRTQTYKYASGLQQGWSVFLSGKIFKKLNYFARFDQYNPDTKLNTILTAKGELTTTDFDKSIGASSTTALTYKASQATYKQTFTILGLDYTVTKRMHIMPNLWYNKYDSMLSNVKGKEKSDYDLVPRITFYIIFNKAKSVDDNGMDN